MRNLTHRFTKSGHFPQLRSTFFHFSKKGRGDLLPPSCAPVRKAIQLNELSEYFISIINESLNGVLNVLACPTCPTCPRALRALLALRALRALPTCSTCPRAQVYFTDQKIKNVGFNDGFIGSLMFSRVLNFNLNFN